MTTGKNLLYLLSCVAAMTCHAQIYTSLANMPQAMLRHSATSLSDGRVLAVQADGATQIFDPTSNQWSIWGLMVVGTADHTATRLVDGSVLVVGGFATGAGVGVARAERYLPTSGAWTSAGNLTFARTSHAAVTLGDGTLLIVGGEDRLGTPATLLSSIERYNSSSNSWSAGPDLPAPRAEHTATTLPNGDVLVLGVCRIKT